MVYGMARFATPHAAGPSPLHHDFLKDAKQHDLRNCGKVSWIRRRSNESNVDRKDYKPHFLLLMAESQLIEAAGVWNLPKHHLLTFP